MVVKHQLTLALPLKELRREEEENKGGGGGIQGVPTERFPKLCRKIKGLKKKTKTKQGCWEG